MTLSEFKLLLQSQSSRQFRMRLPDGSPVPVAFHITEVGLVRKTFIDCGGMLRHQECCQLQVWIGPDTDHRLEAGKAARILEKAAAFLPDETIPVEIEYEDRVISQYTIEGFAVETDAVVLMLGHKHTDCLAKELCGVPAVAPTAATSSCCGPKGCC